MNLEPYVIAALEREPDRTAREVYADLIDNMGKHVTMKAVAVTLGRLRRKGVVEVTGTRRVTKAITYAGVTAPMFRVRRDDP